MDFKQTAVWRDAVKLALKLYNLIDDLPQGEEGLADSLRAAAMTIPGQVGAAVITKQLPPLESLVGLEAQIEVINQVYPALETSGVEKAAEAIRRRMTSPADFAASDS